jgi:uncharacterized membrane protein YfhO
VHEMADVPILKETRNTLNPQMFHKNSVFSSKVLNIKYALIKDTNEFEVITADKIMPRATLIKKVTIMPLEKQMEYIKKTDFDPQQEILLESPLKTNSASDLRIEDNNVIITKYQPNRIELTCNSIENQILVLSELYYPGWNAYIDGKKQQIFRADYLLRAIPVAQGNHNVVFVYKPKSLLIGGAITALTLLVIIIILLKSYLSRLKQ